MKIWNLYENEVDKTWYDSSNILYSECDDLKDSLKVVRITFLNGRVYKYIDVDVNDYLMFREATSQGKAFNTYIRKYQCERLEDTNVDSIKEKMNETMEKQTKVSELNVKINDDSIEIFKLNDSIGTINVKNESIEDIKKLLNLIRISYE